MERNYLNVIRNRLKKSWKKVKIKIYGSRMKKTNIQKPQLILLEYKGRRYRFHVYSKVEKYRIRHFGGEEQTWREFLGGIQPNDVVFDIGASNGLYTVTIAGQVREGQVIAFEPDPDTRSRLLENIQLNGLENVRVIDWAVSDRSGKTILFSDGAGGFAPSFVLQDREGAPRGRVEVEMRAIDEVLSHGELPIPTVLKVDIEGAEALFLRGARKLLGGTFGKKPRWMLFEIHPDILATFNVKPNDLIHEIEGYGYSRVKVVPRKGQYHIIFKHS